MSKRPTDEAHGMSQREQAIMDLAEDGMTTAAIAAELGIKAGYVRKVYSMYSSDGDHTAFCIMARQGCAAMAAAIAATGRGYA
jgi:transposase-like protein